MDYRTEKQNQEATDRFALRLAEIVKANRHNPRGADIEAMLDRAKALSERNTREIEAYFVCFHASRGIVDQIGEYGTLRAAVLAAECEALHEQRQANIYPVYSGGMRGKRIARATPHRMRSGKIEVGLAYDR